MYPTTLSGPSLEEGVLTPHQIALVKATVPVLKTHGEAITQAFYALLFAEHPALESLFDARRQASGEQPRALAAAIMAYAANVDRLENLTPALGGIARRHCHLGVAPEHYPIVGEVLLRAIRETLGAAATPEILDAWSAAYAQLARVMIGIERAMTQESQCALGGQ